MRNLCVDGINENDKTFQGDGTLPPFVVFDKISQKNIAGPFETRQEAEAHRLEILNGLKPIFDKKAISDWIYAIDNESEEK